MTLQAGVPHTGGILKGMFKFKFRFIDEAPMDPAVPLVEWAECADEELETSEYSEFADDEVLIPPWPLIGDM